MKTRLLLLFIIFPAIVFSQTKVTGKVLDKETQKPVSDVIIHSSGKISITNDKGEYDFEINQPETVYFRHLSYSSFKIQSDSLQNNGVVYLTANVTELSEVVISPNRANYLLNKAIDNLFANFQKAKSKMYYLTHVEENTTKGGEREVYALIETFLDRVRNDKKRFFNWDVKLIWLDRTKIMVENDFSVGGKDFSVSFFPEYIRFSSGKTKKDTATFFSEVYDENSDYWIIKVYTQYPDKRHYHYFLYTISRQD
ncbi:MAG: carboxypeptidase-like regulatory domain-containing protein, partial [Bacteroidales bacterium]|nr:carboxypeptidase-like regulatory domain-containing protein [Bacteroidales bacterium]